MQCAVELMEVGMGKDGEIVITEQGRPGPLCPHCSGELRHVQEHKGKIKMLVELHVLSCPHCRKVLEVRSISR